ncbi:MAG TPA: glycosyltransferase family 2 protein [Actinomycetota bacterium]|nr:glycosyltransferase family 2 protein [Actinomycetota bacterium]
MSDPRQARKPPETLSVLIPVLNEIQTLRPALERLLKTDLGIQLDVLVVDDGSTDGSLGSIDDLVQDGLVRTVRHETNRGKGAALRTGIAEARGDLVTVLDSDLEYDPADYKMMIRAVVEEEASVVYGTRTFGAHTAFSFWYVIGNRAVSFWASFLFNTWLSDLETCFKMAWRDIWTSLSLQENGFGIEAEVTGKFLLAGHRIHEVPISYRARGREEGKKLRWTDGVQALWILLKLRLLPGLSRTGARK